jgi:3D (Asp-Asp-Asp) domain-containing protein
MRIISACVALGTLLILGLPQPVKAFEAEKSNETKINLKIENSTVINSESILENNGSFLIAYDPNNYKSILTDKIIDQSSRGKVIAKFQNKNISTSLPEGKFIINASAYTAAADECGKSDGITASGLAVRENETIACPREFPFGTKLKIDGMGTYICQDRGGAIRGNHVDIYMKTKSQAFIFGRKNILAEVIN